MLSDKKVEFTKETIDLYLKEVAKEYRKLVGQTMPAEIVLIGGASVMINYGFRNMTSDVDAAIRASSSMKDAISRVGDKYDLPVGWLNSDFLRTNSYTPRLYQYSDYYKTFSNVVAIRTVSAEYLIAMKLMAGRRYKNDLSDIVGVLAEHEKQGSPISMERIETAVQNLYGDWEKLPDNSKDFIGSVMKKGHFEKQYQVILEGEKEVKDALVSFENKYPGVTTESNVNEILEVLKQKTKQQASGKKMGRER